ncbi:unnamed protein product [Linum tenue]|uniref:Uncharacterized protein n=1 Tax=Linum tenue TaxID=586396 RepID=A0AAV0PDS8_9ROSI|nr:unnamed protein product [Linum tenue]
MPGQIFLAMGLTSLTPDQLEGSAMDSTVLTSSVRTLSLNDHHPH